MTEKAPKARGEFTLQVLNKKGEVIDQFQDNNLVVNAARASMSALLSGKTGAIGITGFVLGTKGHVENPENILVPKAVGQDGYDETRTRLFSEEQQTPFYYTVSWTQGALTDSAGGFVAFDQNEVEFEAKGQKKNQTGTENDAENGKIPVKITLQDTSVLYEFNIPETYANGADGNSVVAYTEAGLKCGTQLFSLKCFSAKTKDVSTSFRILWKIIF